MSASERQRSDSHGRGARGRAFLDASPQLGPFTEWTALEHYFITFGGTISAGSSEIQRNIIAEKVLGCRAAEQRFEQGERRRALDAAAQQERPHQLAGRNTVRRRRAQEALLEGEVHAGVARADSERGAGEVVGALVHEGLADHEHQVHGGAQALLGLVAAQIPDRDGRVAHRGPVAVHDAPAQVRVVPDEPGVYARVEPKSSRSRRPLSGSTR
jgi:hypothetical protein